MDAQGTIKQQVTSHPVALYMKGTPQFPQCGFSATAVQILYACGVKDFFSVNVLEEPEIRLPQDVFAKMLGVQRTSVNPILQRLRAEGLIELGRSRLIVTDRAGLSARACECYETMSHAQNNVLTHPPVSNRIVSRFHAPDSPAA